MAQTYTADVPDGTTNILQDNINGRNNENTLRSSFSGTAFPGYSRGRTALLPHGHRN